jgi:iron complex outermembrane receptor protein
MAFADPPRPYETVVVAPATRDPASGDDPAAATSVVTSDRTQRSGESLSQLLSEMPGTAVTRYGGFGGTAFLSLRGSTWDQVRIYVDGVPLNLAAGGAVDLSSIALGSIERIEVYRAMSPITAGTSALGGIVAITTRQPRVTGGEADAGFGSFGTRFASAGGAVASGPVRVYADLHLLGVRGDFPYHWDNATSNNPSDDEIRLRANNEMAQGDAVVRAAVTLSPTRELQLSLSGIDRRQQLPGYGVHLASEARLTTLRAVGSLTYTGRNDLGPGGRLQVQAYTLLTEERFWDPLGQISFKQSDSRDRTTTVGITVRASRAAAAWLKVAGVIDARSERFAPRDRRDGMDFPGDPSTRLFAAGGIEADAWWQRLRLGVIPSLRWEIARDVHSGRTSFDELLPAGSPVLYSRPIARLGLVQRPTAALTIKANVGRYARQPSFLELYGNNGFILGDPDLRPESAINGDVGVGWRKGGPAGGLAVDAAAFGAAVTDLIQFEQTGYGRSHPENVGRARILGVETSVDGQLGKHGRLVGQFTFTDARDTSTSASSRGRQLPLRPRLRAYARPEVRAVDIGPLRTGLYADVDVTSGNFLDTTNLAEVPARVLFGAGASLEWPRGGLRLTASLQNVGNALISDVTGYPLPGRALYVTLAGTTSHEQEPERIHP